METKKLQEYLSILVDMESSVYFQTEAIALINQKIRETEQRITGINRDIEDLNRKKDSHQASRKEPVKPQKPSTGALPWILLIVALVITFFLFGSSVTFFQEAVIDKSLRDVSLAATRIFLGVVFGGLGLFLGLPFTIGCIASLRDNAKAGRKYKSELMKHPRLVSEYNVDFNKKLSQFDDRIREKNLELRRNQEALQYLMQQRAILVKQREASKKTLAQLYDYNIIYSKWRGFANVCNLYDYIASGMCSRLEGGDGAYAQLMQDLRTNRICGSIDEAKTALAQSLNRIAANQSALLHEMRLTNERLDTIDRGIHSATARIERTTADMHKSIEQSLSGVSETIRKQSELQRYCDDRIHKELQYANRMNYLAGNYDRVFYNLPPT